MDTTTDRIAFLDNLRALVVMLVVVLHAVAAYAIIISWWPVQEFPKPMAYSIIILLLDLFCMPTLFFVAGYFAPRSLERHGFAGFLTNKFRRLGIPFVLLALFLAPFMSYLGYFLRTESPDSFFTMWWFQLKTALDPGLVLFDSPEVAMAHMNDYSLWHLWFLSLLLLFFLLYAATARYCPAVRAQRESGNSRPRILLGMMFAGVVAAAAISGANLLTPDWSWLKSGGYLLVQPCRVGLYLVMFCLGVRAWNRNWFSPGSMPLPLALWLGLALVASMMVLGVGKTLNTLSGPAPLGVALTHGLARSIAALAWLGTLLKGTQLWWNSRGNMARSLSASSYDIYLLHLPVVMAVQYVALFLPVSYAIKALLATVAGIALPWLLSAHLVRPYPRLAAALLVAAWGVACVVW